MKRSRRSRKSRYSSLQTQRKRAVVRSQKPSWATRDRRRVSRRLRYTEYRDFEPRTIRAFRFNAKRVARFVQPSVVDDGTRKRALGLRLVDSPQRNSQNCRGRIDFRKVMMRKLAAQVKSASGAGALVRWRNRLTRSDRRC